MSTTQKKTIRGKIIRIVDTSTVVINLGSSHGITQSSVFSILGQPEALVDPFTNEDLGNVSIVKGRVKASIVSDKFTIATSKWTQQSGSTIGIFGLNAIPGYREITDKEEKDLRVKKDDIKPWKAVGEDFVQIGDEVEVTIDTDIESPKIKLRPRRPPK
jgi:hypothetical protein